jgi:hypothetical protein
VALTGLVGWHWEFTPSVIGKLVPGIDMVPFWTLAVVNVYRKWKRVQAPGDQIDVMPTEQKLLKTDPKSQTSG